MFVRRTNVTAKNASEPGTPADACFAAMERHNARKPPSPPQPPPGPVPAGSSDIIYGGRAIAAYIFPDEDPERTRRRVFGLWAYHRDRKERAGFFKLKGALCLSKSQWRSFHGLE